MIARIVSHKMLGLGAAFLNVIFAAAVLDTQSSVLYLTSFSIIQILMAFAGCGIAHKLVTYSEKEVFKKKTWPWFVLSLLVGGIFLGLQAYLSDASQRLPIFCYMLVIAMLAVMSEWIRCAIASHFGFVIYNVLILVTAVSILLAGKFSYANVLFALAALALLSAFAFRDIHAQRELISLEFEDVIRAGRIASVNQYYSIAIYLVSLFSHAGLEVLTLILVYRFNIFFNWQSFYWLRFGHKRLGDGIEASHYRDNFRALWLNFAAITSVTVVALCLLKWNLLESMNARGFDAHFLHLLLLYGWARTLLNFLFPFELFVLYGTKLATDMRFVAVSVVSFVCIAVGAMVLPNIISLMIFVELFWLVLRIYSKSVFEATYRNSSAGFVVWQGK